MKNNFRILRKMGYLAESRGLIERYINSEGAWDDHLKNSRNFIVHVLRERQIGNLAIYGSGWLLDVPVEELSGMAGNVFLYDIVHPPQVLQRIKKYKNVIAIKADITGGDIAEAFKLAKTYRKTRQVPATDTIFSNRFIPEVRHDFSVSLNVLSQIGEMVTGYLSAHIPFDETEIEILTRRLQQNHVELLTAGRSCLVSDIRENYYNMEGELMGSKEIIKCSLPLTKHSGTWEWQFDLSGDYMQGLKTIYTVIAMEI